MYTTTCYFLYKKLSLNDVIPVSANSSNQLRMAAEAILCRPEIQWAFYKAVYHPNHPNDKRSTDIDFCEVDQLFAYNLTGYIIYKNKMYIIFIIFLRVIVEFHECTQRK